MREYITVNTSNTVGNCYGCYEQLYNIEPPIILPLSGTVADIRDEQLEPFWMFVRSSGNEVIEGSVQFMSDTTTECIIADTSNTIPINNRWK